MARLICIILLTLVMFLPNCKASQKLNLNGFSLGMLKMNAFAGDAKAQAGFAYLYFDGILVSKDYSKALFWATKSAEQGIAIAQNLLGIMHFQGLGTPINYMEALKWFTKAATQGQPDAQCRLGLMYNAGLGTRSSDEKALKWLTKSAEQGNSVAYLALGYMYIKRGDYKDYIQAYTMHSIATALGSKEASNNIELLQKRMTPKQIEIAQKKADEIWNAFPESVKKADVQ